MKPRSLFWGIVGGLSGGIALSLVGLLIYTSITTSNSHILDETFSSAGTATDRISLDLSNIKDISDTSNLMHHSLELIQFFETATFDQILGLLNQATNSPSNFHTWYIKEFLVERLASMDPQATLDAVQSMRSSRHLNLISILYSEWATQDPIEAIKSAAQQATHIQRVVIRSIVSKLSIPLSSELLKLADSLNIDSLLDQVLADVTTKQLLRSSPQAAFNSIFSDNVNNLQQESLLSEVIWKWLSDADDEALTLLLTSFREAYAENTPVRTGLYVSPSERMFLNLLNQIVQKDPRKFWELNLNNPSDFQDSLRYDILHVWVGLDPQAAMEAVSELKGSAIYEESYRTVWMTWAEVEPTVVLQNIQKAEQEIRETVIAFAVRSLASTKHVEQALSSIVQMKELGENIGRGVRLLTEAWIEFDVTAATDWLITTDSINDTLRQNVLETVIPALSHTDPLRAYQLAVEYGEPNERYPQFTLENRVIESLAERGDFERAIELLEIVDESLMVTARSTIGMSLVSFGKIDEAIALGAELSSSEQSQYFQNLANQWFYLRPDELFENIAQLPTVQSQQAIAGFLLEEWRGYRADMSQDEIAILENLVSEHNLQ